MSAGHEVKKRHLRWLSVNSSYSHSSLALPLLHAACREIDGWEWSVLETTVGEDAAETAVRLAASDCDLVCATLYLFNRNAVLEILQRFHLLQPDVPIAVGGPECLGNGAEELLARFSFLHVVFRGEGEELFPRFLKGFPESLKNRILPESGNGVFADWAASPPPVLDPFFRTDRPFVQMETSRGCPMGCLYCTSCRTDFRFKSIDAVAEELEILRSRGVREIRVLDRTFNFPPSRGEALLKLFRTRFPEMRFHLEVHPQFLDATLREELSEAAEGQLHLEAGVQSLDPAVQNAIGRRGDREEVLSGLRFLCGQPGLAVHTDLLSGLPEQSLESLLEDVSTLIAVGPAEIQLEVLKVLPGTPLRARAGELGILFSPETPYDVIRSSRMSPEEILTARDISRILDLTSNHPSLHSVIRLARLRNAAVIPDLLTFFRANGFHPHRLYDLKKRFLLLETFLSGSGDAAASFRLSSEWIRAGYPPGEGPGKRAEALPELPDGARAVEGNPACARERETKFWCVREEEDTFCFAFNRKYSINRPAGIWRIGSGRA